MHTSRSAIRPILFAAAALCLPAAAALAQGHGDAVEHAAGHAGDAAHEPAGVLPTLQQGIAPMIVSLVVFGIVLAVLATTAWPKILKGLKDREDKIRNEIDAAETAQKQAHQALQDYEKNLAQARAESQRMLEDTKAQQQLLANELRAKAEVELNAMRDKAKRDIENAKRAAIDDIYNHAAGAATQMAAKILKREIGAHDQQRLIQESLGELQAAVAASN